MITKPLLAEKAESDKIVYPVLATPKLDGIRAVKVGGKLVSRTFKPIPNVNAQRILAGLPEGIDGEIMLADPKATFQDITSAVMSQTKEADFLYCAFDYVSTSLDKPYHLRIRELVELFEDAPLYRGIPIRILVPKLIKNKEELDAYEAKCLEEGYEGVMIRNPEGRYKCGRSSLKEGILLKVKQFEDAEAVIVECFERMKNTNEQERDELGHAKRSTAKAGMVPTGTLGGFSVKDIKTGAEFSIGSGLNDQLRKEFWDTKESLIGKIVKYKYQPIGVKEIVPRFPIFLGIRDASDMS